MWTFKKWLLRGMISYVFPAAATDVADYASFYTQYKTNVTPQNALTITADLTATGNLYGPASTTTTIDGGGFQFNGDDHIGFVIGSDQSLSLTNGGTFQVVDNALTVSSSYSSFEGNLNGSVFQNQGGSVVLEKSVFTDNQARRNGGVIDQQSGSSLTVTNSAFRGNKVTLASGGVLANDYETSATITDTFFERNSAYRDGGALFNDGVLTVERSYFLSNSAGSGAAVYNSNQATFTDVVFNQNTGAYDVGAVYNSGQLEITRGTFTQNTGWSGGAVGNIGVLGDDMYVTINDSTFTDNSAVSTGGALYNGDVAYVIDSTFRNNTAEEGGAIFNMGILNIIALDKDVVFEGNTASGESNAIETTGTMHLNAGVHFVIFNDKITGDGQIIVNPDYALSRTTVPTTGTIILNEDMTGYKGSVDIKSGTVQVGQNGRFFNASDLTVESGTLDIGLTQAVVQNAVFGSGSRLALAIQDSTTYGSLVADTVSVTNGATLYATLSPDALGIQSKIELPLIQSTQVFDDVFSPTINNNLYTFSALGNGWYEIAQTSSFTDVVTKEGGSQNNQNTAQAWETDPAQSGPAHDMFIELDALAQNNGADFVKALTALAPSSIPVMQVLSLSLLDQFQSAVDADSNRQTYRIGDGILWVAGTAEATRLGKTAAYASTHIYGNGISAGAEYTKANWTLGAAYMYRHDRLKNMYRSMRIPTHGAGLYTSYQPGPFVWTAKVSYFYSHLKENKNVVGYGVSNKLSLETVGAQSDVGYRLDAGSWQIIPKIGAQYAMIRHKTAQDTVGQTLKGKRLQFFTPYVQIAFEKEWQISPSISLRPSLEIGTSYDLSTSKDNALVRLVDGITYTVAAERLPRWQQNVSVNLTADVAERFELQLNASAGLRTHYQDYAGMIKAVYAF